MWAFRETATVVELLGYNMSEMIIVLPFYELGPLSRVLCDLSIDWSIKTVLQLADNVFDALSIVHEAQICHNDVKSANFLVSLRNGRMHAVLTDFGVCTLLDAANAVAGLDKNSVIGKTICYSSPEILEEGKRLPQVMRKARDVFAASVILNELVTRELAWSGSQFKPNDEVVTAVLAGQRPDTTPHSSLIDMSQAVE